MIKTYGVLERDPAWEWVQAAGPVFIRSAGGVPWAGAGQRAPSADTESIYRIMLLYSLARTVITAYHRLNGLNH